MTTRHLSTPDVLSARCPRRQITLTLPLATIERFDELAHAGQVSRQQLLAQIINVALLTDTPWWPAGDDPIEQPAEQAYRLHVRSLQLAVETRP
jgi:hypothetical protein